MTKTETLAAIDDLIAELQAEANSPVPPQAQIAKLNAQIASLQAVRTAVDSATF